MFGEKRQEKNRAGQTVDVWVLPKYEESKEKALAIIKDYKDIEEGDFWILKNETKTGTVMYSGLIMSHNACLKINDTLDAGRKFDPDCVEVDKDGYGGSLVFTYKSKKQGIYEVGEVSAKNCKQAYPYAMALKRCFDRVVLKSSKLAYSGIYSESESDTFIREENPSNQKPDGNSGVFDKELAEKVTRAQAQTILDMIDETDTDRNAFMEHYGVEQFLDMTKAQYADAIDKLMKKKGKK